MEYSRHVGSTAGSNKWAYALTSGVCPYRKRARRTASTKFEGAMQSAFQEKFAYTMAVWSLFVSVMELRLWKQLLSRVLQRYAFVTWDPDKDGGAVVAVVIEEFTLQTLTRSPDPC